MVVTTHECINFIFVTICVICISLTIKRCLWPNLSFPRNSSQHTEIRRNWWNL